MESMTFALFGEAEKGEFKTAYLCKNLAQLEGAFGHPPPESQGLFYAIQALLYNQELIFFRVEEEGISSQDYFYGLNLLKDHSVSQRVSAVCVPGVGDQKMIEAFTSLCFMDRSVLIITPADLYDYLTNR
jgi:hypothetical protein